MSCEMAAGITTVDGTGKLPEASAMAKLIWMSLGLVGMVSSIYSTTQHICLGVLMA